jgi:hypothetical protein
MRQPLADHGGRHVSAVGVEPAAESTVAIAVAGGALDQVDPDEGRAGQLLKPMARPAGVDKSFDEPRPNRVSGHSGAEAEQRNNS